MFDKWEKLVNNNYLFNQYVLIIYSVHYEQLVLQPKITMEHILSFLNIPWNENVLHHEDFINEENGVMLSK